MAGLGTRHPRHRQARRRALRRDPERADQQAGKLDRIATNAPNPVTSHIPRWSLSRQIEQTPDKTVRSQNHNNDTEVENPMTRAHDATAAAITHTAAQLLARHQNPTVGAVAQATGVARGTVYRYFPTRQALLTAVLDQALLEADRRLTQANLTAVPIGEGLARAVRALVGLGDDFLVLVDQRLLTGGDIPAFAAVVGLLDRGRQAGDLRRDLPLECQVEALFALVHACLRASEPAAMGPEDISATVLRLFLEGSKPPPTAPPH